jgi:hypothetical protein
VGGPAAVADGCEWDGDREEERGHIQARNVDGMAELSVDSDATSRARRLVATVGGRYASEVGIDVDAGDDEVERWPAREERGDPTP